MEITSARFLKGAVGHDELLESSIPKVAFIGRSNVGKSSTINALTKHKNLAVTSSRPGRTREINIFLINNSLHLIDLPGYGYARVSKFDLKKIHDLIAWYLFESNYVQKKVILIIDALVGLTQDDKEMLFSLESRNKDIVVVANKIDKIKKSELLTHLKKLQATVGDHILIPFSAEKKIGIDQLAMQLLSEG